MLYEKLDYVLAIAEEQNLTRAAKKLYISQPTLTMYLNRLEESLGVRLFDRKKNPVLLTAAGKYYIEKMREISEAEQVLRGELHTIGNTAKTFRIGSGRVRGHYWLPSLMARLLDQHPDLNIVLTQGSEKQLQKLLEKNTLDMAIGSFSEMPEADIPLVVEDIVYEKMLLVAHRKFGLVPQEYREKNSPDYPYELDPAKLQNLPFITPPPANGLYANFQKMIGQYGIQPSHTIVVDMMTTGLLMAEQGIGVQLISAPILAELPTEERRRKLDYSILPGFPEARSCSVSWRKETEDLPLIRETVRLLKEEILPQQLYTEVIE